VRRLILAAGLVLAIAVLATAALGATAQRSAHHTATGASGSITFDGVWSGAEATAFGDVIKAFNKTNPNVHVNYKSLGDNLPTILATSIAGGRPPDMADIAQPGLIQQFATKGSLKPITYAKGVMSANFAPSWIKLGTFNGKFYGLVFKASNKSTVWYNVHAFKNAGVTPPATFTAMIKDAGTIRSSGVPPFSIGGSDGWTLTDLFENIYLRQAGVAKYNLLTAHKLKWTDASVTAALKHGSDHRQRGEHGRRNVRRRADPVPGLGQQRVRESAEGRDRDRG
jgi:alpha-glucoside transport system substrate-binding protein